MKVYKLNLLFDGQNQSEEFFLSKEKAKEYENIWLNLGAGVISSAYIETSIKEVEIDILNECLDKKYYEIKLNSK